MVEGVSICFPKKGFPTKWVQELRQDIETHVVQTTKKTWRGITASGGSWAGAWWEVNTQHTNKLCQSPGAAIAF